MAFGLLLPQNVAQKVCCFVLPPLCSLMCQRSELGSQDLSVALYWITHFDLSKSFLIVVFSQAIGTSFLTVSQMMMDAGERKKHRSVWTGLALA